MHKNYTLGARLYTHNNKEKANTNRRENKKSLKTCSVIITLHVLITCKDNLAIIATLSLQVIKDYFL